MNLSQIGTEVLDLIEWLERDYSDREVNVGVVAIVVELDETSDGDEYTGIHYRCSDPRRWVQAGLFAGAQRAVYATEEEEDAG